MIEVAELEVEKGSNSICRVAQLSVAVGDRLVVVGCNGSGKTTLLRVLAGLETDYRGSCRVDAETRQRVYVHQQPFLFRGTVLANVMYGLRAHGRRGKEGERLATGWLERFSIQHLVDRRVSHLSGGEAKRVALARALAIEPMLLLLDEPMAEMDDAGRNQVAEVLCDPPRQTTVVIATPVKPPAGLATQICELGSSGA